MGIGAAFATGLVKGFTQNIEKEEAKRLAEQAKVDAFEQTALQAVLTGKATNKGYSAVADLIKSARQQMNDRKPIDMFGRATDGLDLDFAKLQGTLEEATEYGTTFGTGQNKIGFNTAISKGIDGKIGRSYLSEVAGFAMDKNFETKLDALDDSQFVAFYNSMGASRRAIIDAEKKSGKDLYEAPDVMGGENSQTYRGLYKLDNYYKKRFGGTTPVSATEGSGLNEIDVQTTAIAEAHKSKTGKMPDTVGMVVNSETGTIQFPMLMYANDADKKQLGTIAGNLGTSTTSLLAYWQTDFMRIPGINSEKQIDALEASVFLGTSFPFIDAVDPDDQLRMMPQETIDDIAKKAASAGAGDLQTFAYALAPYMKGPKKPTRPAEWGSVRDVKTETIQQYILTRVYGEDKADQVSFKDFRDGQTALDTTYGKLLEIEEEMKGIDAPLVYDKYKGKFGAAFDLEQGIFGGMVRDLGISVGRAGELKLNDDENLTIEYSEYLSDRVRQAGKAGVKFAELEAMRISLAFEMARAADPSGRLSNQDIEQQLRKLGSDWQTSEQAVAAIQVAKKEFKLKAEQYKVLVRLGESQRTATERDYKIIDGTIAADYILRNKGVKYNTGAVGSGKPPVDVSNIVVTPSGNYIDSATGLPATEDQMNAIKLQNEAASSQKQEI